MIHRILSTLRRYGVLVTDLKFDVLKNRAVFTTVLFLHSCMSVFHYSQLITTLMFLQALSAAFSIASSKSASANCAVMTFFSGVL